MHSINYFWVGNSISRVELLTFKACFKNNHEPVVWCYEKIQALPEFVTQKDAAEILDKKLFDYYFKELKLPIANISDIFRYHLLHKIGGFYTDTDVVIVKNMDSLVNQDFFCSTFEYFYGECANGCMMWLNKQSATTQYLLNECDKRIAEIESVGIENVDYCILGPFLIQDCAKVLPIKVLPYDIVNPISWRWTKQLIAFEKTDWIFQIKKTLRSLFPSKESRGYNITDKTMAIHLFNEMWKINKLDKNKHYHSSSLFEKLNKIYNN